MKKIIGTILIFILVGIIGFMILPQEVTDRINPLIPKETVYVQVNQPPDPSDLRYEYTLTGYTADGEKKTIAFSASKKLQQGSYLKVSAKGSYVRNWEEVQFNELPSKIKN